MGEGRRLITTVEEFERRFALWAVCRSPAQVFDVDEMIRELFDDYTDDDDGDPLGPTGPLEPATRSSENQN